jgi:hypothetical protein
MPIPCPCGCQRPVKPGRRYATKGCGGRAHLKAMPRAWHQAAVRARIAKLSQQDRSLMGQRLAKANTEIRWEALLDRWLRVWEQGGDPRQAITVAYRYGYNAGYTARRRHEQRKARVA